MPWCEQARMEVVIKAPCFLWAMLWEERGLAGAIITLTTVASGPASLKALGEENAPQKAPGLYSGMLR